MAGSTLQQIFTSAFAEHASNHPLPRHVIRAAERITQCRTAALGGHVQACPEGHVRRVWYNSCRHRSCPQCAYVQGENWLARQRSRLLECDHYHVIFTLPEQLNPLWLANRKPMADLLFAAVRETLFELLGDAKYLGAKPGLIAALHTWGQTLVLHPHVHCLVTGGGLMAEGEWRRVRKRCLLPRRVLMLLFRGKFLWRLRRAVEGGALVVPKALRRHQLLGLLNKLGRATWNVRIEPRYRHGAGVVTYLARYLRGGPISRKRILSFDGQHVRFAYRDNRDLDAVGRPKPKVMQLRVESFLSRFLLHVPPPRSQMVRCYGVYANGNRADLDRCRTLLGQGPVEDPAPVGWQALCDQFEGEHPERCPVCGLRLVRDGEVAPARAPPLPVRPEEQVA